MTSIGRSRLCSLSFVLFFASMSTTHNGTATAQNAPTKAPTPQPTSKLTKAPTTAKPTKAPTTAKPTKAPTTAKPTKAPTTSPTSKLSPTPTITPTTTPTSTPTTAPTPEPGYYCGTATNVLVRTNTTDTNVGGLFNALADQFCGYDLSRGPGRWYKYIALTSALTTVTTSPPASGQEIVDSVLSIVTDPICSGNPSCIGYNDDADSIGNRYSSVSFNATANVTYYILVSGFNSDCCVGSFGLYIDAAPAIGVASGEAFSCVLLSGGSVMCWGKNTFGQLGDGTTTNRLAPVSVISLGGAATAVAAGYYHACALLSGGSVKCWGYNSYGQLGDGTTANRFTPVSVISLGGAVTAIAAGFEQTCALLSNGSLKCWGGNFDGQLGDGTTTGRVTPVSVIVTFQDNIYPISQGVAVAAGYEQTCALVKGGYVICWGNNSFGQLGDGTTTNRLTAVTVISLGGVTVATAIAAGAFHMCALIRGGSIQCWGRNFSGQLGDGTTTDSVTPVSVISLGGVATAVAAGILHTCALLTGGSVKCWGWNIYGQLGDGSTTSRITPAPVVSLGGAATAITAGWGHTCASLSDGSVRCWGWNGFGQLGDGTTTNCLTPGSVTGL